MSPRLHMNHRNVMTCAFSFALTTLPSRTQARRANDVNRESGTETANRRWLQ